MTRLSIAGMLVAGAAAAWPSAAGAGGRAGADSGLSHDRGPREAGPAFRYGFDRGWREGSEEGHRDGRRCREARSRRGDEYGDGGRSYRRWMGPRGDYVAGFRRGYEAGYRRAYAAARPGWRDCGRDQGEGRYPRDDRHRW